jgi:hypothetical protein
MTDVINTKQLEDVFKSVEANTKFLVDAVSSHFGAHTEFFVDYVCRCIFTISLFTLKLILQRSDGCFSPADFEQSGANERSSASLQVMQMILAGE